MWVSPAGESTVWCNVWNNVHTCQPGNILLSLNFQGFGV